MNKNRKSLDATFFNNLYQQNQDPWNFEESPYEKEKYEQTLNMIPGDSYANGFEIGCANGVLTQMLIRKCRRLLAVDSSAIAVANATKRLGDYPAVTIREMEIPKDFPNEKFDLMLFSEVGYFLIEDDLLIARNKMLDCLLPGAHLLLVHWTPTVAEFPLTGDQVHELFFSVAGEKKGLPLLHLKQRKEAQYRMDLFLKK